MKNTLALILICSGVAVYFLPDDPKTVNYIILAIYLLSAFWWFMHRHPVDGCYWLSAFAITATVTFGYNRG